MAVTNSVGAVVLKKAARAFAVLLSIASFSSASTRPVSAQTVADFTHMKESLLRFTDDKKPFLIVFIPPDPTACPACISELQVGWSHPPKILSDSTQFIAVGDSNLYTSRPSDIKFALVGAPSECKGFLGIFVRDSLWRISKMGNSDNFLSDYRLLDSLLFLDTPRMIRASKGTTLSIMPASPFYYLAVNPIDTSSLFQVYSAPEKEFYLCDLQGSTIRQILRNDTTVATSAAKQFGGLVWQTPHSVFRITVQNAQPIDTVIYNHEGRMFTNRTLVIDELRANSNTNVISLNSGKSVYPGNIIVDPVTHAVWLYPSEDGTGHHAIYRIDINGKSRKLPGVAVPTFGRRAAVYGDVFYCLG
ncbi:MAG: hypothetical protein ACREBW_06405, partial [Candidatus Micrarchaeaceae archaeon]